MAVRKVAPWAVQMVECWAEMWVALMVDKTVECLVVYWAENLVELMVFL
jgi:hypothetical protein